MVKIKSTDYGVKMFTYKCPKCKVEGNDNFKMDMGAMGPGYAALDLWCKNCSHHFTAASDDSQEEKEAYTAHE